MLNKINQEAGANSLLNSAQGDILQTVTINNFLPKANSISLNSNAIQKLIQAYRDEKKKPLTDSISMFINKLERFSTNPDGDILTLKQKLENGGRGDDYELALELEEMYWMFLNSNKFSKSIQRIHAFLLAKVFTLFHTYVSTEIRKRDSTRETINHTIMEKVINPVVELLYEELDSDDDLELYTDDVYAMIYFLTGKCHLKWV